VREREPVFSPPGQGVMRAIGNCWRVSPGDVEAFFGMPGFCADVART